MSLFPKKDAVKTKEKDEKDAGYESMEQLLVGPARIISHTPDEKTVGLLIYRMFTLPHENHQHPKTIPKILPERRGKRHRHPKLRRINDFRHWWKSSRLLVRLSGAYGWCLVEELWIRMATFNVAKRSGSRRALKQVKRLGRGGVNREFLRNVHPFTRTLRLFIGFARAFEARVDNRFYEVGVAEAMAFMGNRCSRYWARHITDSVSQNIAFPFSAWLVAPYLDQQSRPVIVFMGIIRALAPFMSSFFGSWMGRSITYATYSAAHYRWRPVQGIFHLHEEAGSYQDLNDDPELVGFARQVAVAIGHGLDPVITRDALGKIGFDIIGAGHGGYALYRRKSPESNSITLLHVTPYGPSILDEMPRYIFLERRRLFFSNKQDLHASDAAILNSALPPDAKNQGFTYSGAYFSSQEWAALKTRYDTELASYNLACKIMGTNRAHIDSTKLERTELVFPPTNLVSLKAFIRTGQTSKKQKKQKKRWKQIQNEVKKMAKLVQKYQSLGKAPHGVILYMEGLDCSGKSSTGGLICDALETSGFNVAMVQYNRPPTEEQKRKPWMDRFSTPFNFKIEDGQDAPDKDDYAALVWDRGPAGDFVYGKLNELPTCDKVARYQEFRTFDMNCRDEGILFCKVLFICDKDSIAETLGKRLAHKKIARDLRTWLDANSVAGVEHEGLEEVELHIDPTDFVAFNKYGENLGIFCEFARNTDNVGHVGAQTQTSLGYDNPWLVVCTSKRHPARLGLMRAFEHQLTRFSTPFRQRAKATDELAGFFGVSPEEDPVITRKGIVEETEHGISPKAFVLSMMLFFLTYSYFHQSWGFNVEDIT